MRHQQYYPQRRKGGMWLIVLIIVVGIIIYANSKGIINLGSIKLGNLNLAGNSCTPKINDYTNSFDLKNNYNMTVISSTQAQNGSVASQFLNTWKSPTQLSNMASYNVSSYPITMVGVRFDTSQGSQPYVFICKSDGSLEETTKAPFC